MAYPAHNRLVDIYISVSDLEVEAAIGVSANPCFIMNSCTLIAEIGQGNQVSCLALLTLGETELFHEVHLPTGFNFSSVYTKR